MATTSYLFIFGRTPKLAFEEISVLFPKAAYMSDDVAYVESDSNPDVAAVMSRVGGVTKIAQVIGYADSLELETLIPLITPKDTKTVGCSFYGIHQIPKQFFVRWKHECEAFGQTIRYIEPKHGTALSTVVVEKKHVTEYCIVKSEKGYCVAKTLVVQPFEEWSMRDYGRPFADAKIGMLPPKVARMVLNIAGKEKFDFPSVNQKVIYDPFCGLGTILAEAFMLGWKVVGSDASQEMVDKTKKNLEWIRQKYPLVKSSIGEIFVSDATHASEKMTTGSVDIIVTEPFMGPTNLAQHADIEPEKVRNIIKGLEKLYIGCLKDWKNILTPKGRIMMALPQYEIASKTYFVKKLVDMCENLGYTIEVGPIEYGREHAVVKRHFYLFQKK